MMEQNDKEVIRQLVDEKILALISEQKALLIKAGPGKDKDVHEVVRELHEQISVYLNVI
jgi:RNA-splicing ligase RtcB